jgi:allantoinase
VDPAALYHRHPVTPYAGRTLTGRVMQTWLRSTALLEGECETPVGRLLKRG